MTEENFFAKVCNEIRFTTYKLQEEKIRKGQAELTAQPNKHLSESKEIDKNGRRKENQQRGNHERRGT